MKKRWVSAQACPIGPTNAKAARQDAEPLSHLFSAEDPAVADLRALDVNALSPLAALNKLYELQQRAKE